MRLLRLRHGDRPRGRAGPVCRRARRRARAGGRGARDDLRWGRHAVDPGRSRPGPTAGGPAPGGRGHRRVQSRDGDARQGSSTGRGWRDACVAGRPELPPASSGGARTACAARADRCSGAGSARRRHPKPQPRLDLRGSGAKRRRPARRPGRPRGARARSRERLRARGEAGHALHASARARARAAGRGHGGLLRGGGRGAARGRLPLVRDGELLPARPRVPPQPRLLAGPRLPGDRRGRGLNAGPRAAQEPARAARLSGGGRGRPPPTGRGRAPDPLRARHGAADARPSARRAARAERAPALVDDAACERLADAGMLVRSDGALALTERGRFLANDVVASVLR